MKDWDFRWFGKGLTGYTHYKQSFDRSFPPARQQPGAGHKRADHSARSTKTDKNQPSQPGKPAQSGSQTGLWLLILAVAALWYLVLLVQPR